MSHHPKRRVITFIFQSLDKTTLGTAAIFGIREDAHLVGNQFSWLSSLFYLGFLAWEFPNSLLLQRFPVAKVMSAIVILWGLIVMCHAVCLTFSSLAAVRFFLGTAESVCGPGTMIVLVMWYTRSEQPSRFGMWVGSGGVAYIIGGVMGYGIGHIEGTSLKSWQLIFLIYGAATVVWGCILWTFLPDSPLTARCLTEEERKSAILRISQNATGIENKTFKMPQFVETMKDLKTWLFTAFALLLNIPNGVFVNFQGIIIKSIGFTGLTTTLMTMPSGAIQLFSCLLATYLASTYHNKRSLMIFLFLLPFLAGVLGLRLFDNEQPWGRLVCMWLCFFYAAPWPVALALANAYTAGHTKRITVNALMIGVGGLGAFIGPFFYKQEEEPYYQTGFSIVFACIVGQIILVACLFWCLWHKNRTREREGREDDGGYTAGMNGFLDLTDGENAEFKVRIVLSLQGKKDSELRKQNRPYH